MYIIPCSYMNFNYEDSVVICGLSTVFVADSYCNCKNTFVIDVPIHNSVISL